MSTSPGGKVELAQQKGQTLPQLVDVMQRLLAPDGCPWDREQTFQSLKKYVLEEACEVMDALDDNDPVSLCDELGDLLLQVVFLAELGRAQETFGPDDVVAAIVAKLVRRHPHVFGDVVVRDSSEVVTNWEAIKAEEKKSRALLDGIPRNMPALARAQKMGTKVSKVGFDWPDAQGSFDKVAEEVSEIRAAMDGGNPREVEEEIGDALFALVNLARHHQVDAEKALGRTADKFQRRFRHVESGMKAKHGGFVKSSGEPVSLAEMDALWDEAKLLEKRGEQQE